MSPFDPNGYVLRAGFVLDCIKKINLDAADAATDGDLERLRTLRAEMDVLHQSMLDIRAEQVADHLERNKPKPGRPWWRFGGGPR